MPPERIGEVVGESTTWNPHMAEAQEPFRYIDISSIDSVEKRIVNSYVVLPSEAPSRARQLVRSGDVLVSTVRPNLNAVAIVPDDLDGATASTGFAVLRPNTAKLDPRYLYQWVRSPSFVRKMTARATGASYPAITDRIVKDSTLPLPSIAEQRRIAALLDKADGIRRNGRESMRLLDGFLRSAFLELFGDLVRNGERRTVVRLGEICEVQLGKMLSEKARVGSNPVPYLRNANIQWRRIDVGSLLKMDFSEQELAKFDLRPGDLLVCEGGEVGRCAIWEGELPRCSFQKALHRIRSRDERLSMEYLQEYLFLLAQRGALVESTSQATIAHLTKVRLEQLEIPLPPRSLQEQFRGLYRSTRRLSERLNLRFDELDRLSDSLTQRSFQIESSQEVAPDA